MDKNGSINEWTYKETIRAAKSSMHTEKNMYRWDVLRHLIEFVEAYKKKLDEYHAVGTPEECRGKRRKTEKGRKTE
ncbi:MAG: hypothetical protein SPL82_01665 [Lachnospiraceae bacterium]|nr:hypothetical protein [Lachnospiraceae bacterium]